MLGQAYAIEVGYAVSATAVLLGLLWLIRNALLEHRDAAFVAKPRIARAMTGGRLYAAWFHLFIISMWNWGSWLSVFRAPPEQAGHFFDHEQWEMRRLIPLLIIWAHGMMIYFVNRSSRRVAGEVLEESKAET